MNILFTFTHTFELQLAYGNPLPQQHRSLSPFLKILNLLKHLKYFFIPCIDQFTNWSSIQVDNFLRERRISISTCDILKAEKIDGVGLAFLCQNQAWKQIGVPFGDGIKIQNLIQPFLPATPVLANDEEETTPHSQTPRKFLAKGDEISYILGNKLPFEKGPSNLDWHTVEFKTFSGQNFTDIHEYEVPFITKLTEFACGCLNRRCNGTIHFGVADSRDGQHDHGEVVGMNLVSVANAVRFQEWLEAHITGQGRDLPKRFRFKKSDQKPGWKQMYKIFALCIGPVRAIRIEGSTNVVLEVDVEPSSNVCLYESFYFLNFQDRPQSCMRQSSSTLSETVTSENTSKWIEDIKKYAEWRIVEDGKNPRTNPHSIKRNLKNLICRNNNNPDLKNKDYKYNLICNRAISNMQKKSAGKHARF